MSAVIAMIYCGEICLASDTKSTDHETGESTKAIKQITINDDIAIGFAGSGNIAQVIMRTLSNPKNEHIVSKLVFSEIPAVLDDIYKSHTAEKQYPDEETRHVSALIVGFNKGTPEIISWDNSGDTSTIRQNNPINFTACVLPPYDLDRDICNEILLESANKNTRLASLTEIAINYFKTVSSQSKFVSEDATIWTRRFPGIIGIF